MTGCLFGAKGNVPTEPGFSLPCRLSFILLRGESSHPRHVSVCTTACKSNTSLSRKLHANFVMKAGQKICSICDQ
jgi:hypothetical protein